MTRVYETIPGHFTFEEFYWRMTRTYCPSWDCVGRFAEIGVEHGRSAAFLAEQLAHMTNIDPKRVKSTLALVDTFTMSSPEEIDARLARFLNDVDVRAEVGLSWEVAERFPDKHFDMVMIDADHAYESVSKDIDAWLPKVKPGGVLAGHDFTEAFPGVMRAVRERFESWNVDRGEPFTDGEYYPVWYVEVRS